ncbi:hypothetical protein GWI33_022457 [Rhynchophorus ferrugineus]|uniref:Uncharacterized protein n=1 Tax=Rhynchophorus ferrugineus TaxID=354439 RepID=A0A834INI7_RHYFE|nr:hypothetical protein GWI33_022457 [Rhynchophorus ferrugineus]
MYFVFVAVEVVSRVNGKMVKDTVWEWKPEVDGSIEANGRRVSKEDTVYDSPIRQLPNTKELGQMDYKMVMDPKRMLMMVFRRDIQQDGSYEN